MNFGFGFLLATQVICITQYGACPEKLKIPAETLTNSALWQPLPIKRAKELYKIYPEVKKINLYRKLPSTLFVSLEISLPFAILGNDVIDATGMVLGPNTASISARPILISKFDKRIVELVYELEKLKISPLKINIFERHAVFDITESKLQVWIDLNNQNPTWNEALQAILSRSKIDGKWPRKIDVRFTNPVVEY